LSDAASDLEEADLIKDGVNRGSCHGKDQNNTHRQGIEYARAGREGWVLHAIHFPDGKWESISLHSHAQEDRKKAGTTSSCAKISAFT
jgi:hypothetical protein